ncbi:hypothetical protein B0T18DRAFT_37052 [Schizothecium vesticola]|uniref:Uncharacterized protein n=1 Tax=Schizothecium vesticola TaxID=314040 RepID=A0AA40KD27_9PEZI|nr:hypothetical protein B0T18DRAFT_37052 [Schizothecium vesticola]
MRVKISALCIDVMVCHYRLFVYISVLLHLFPFLFWPCDFPVLLAGPVMVLFRLHVVALGMFLLHPRQLRKYCSCCFTRGLDT